MERNASMQKICTWTTKIAKFSFMQFFFFSWRNPLFNFFQNTTKYHKMRALKVRTGATGALSLNNTPFVKKNGYAMFCIATQPETKCILRTFRVMANFYIIKSRNRKVVFVLWFCLFQWSSFYLSQIYSKISQQNFLKIS